MAAPQLQQDLQNELTTSNQLLKLISSELNQIKEFTRPGGMLEKTIKQNGSLLETLASIQQIDFENIDPISRSLPARPDTQNASNELDASLRKSPKIDESESL